MEAAREAITLFVEDVTGNWTRLIVEVIQFVILVFGVWVLAVGLGKRRGILVGAIDRRAEQTAADLALVQTAPTDLEDASIQAERIKTDGDQEAGSLLREATLESEAIRRDAADSADRESAAIRERAEAALEEEMAEMRADIRDELVNIVADATRSVMNEQLSLPEQRELIQRAILASVADRGKKDRTRVQDAAQPEVT